MNSEKLRQLYQLVEKEGNFGQVRLITVVAGEHLGDKLLMRGDEVICEHICDRNLSPFLSLYTEEFLKYQNSQVIHLAGNRIFIEQVAHTKKLVICGAGHVSLKLLLMAKMIGLYVIVCDDRPFFAKKAEEAGADQVYCEPFEVFLKREMGDQDTFFVIMTRGHEYDIACLRLICEKDFAYAGLMGSRTRVNGIRDKLLLEGCNADKLYSVNSPIGLSIHAETPEEIAVAVLAEIISVKNAVKGSGVYDDALLLHLTDKDGSGKKGCLATIISRSGSAPRAVGTHMYVDEKGKSTGTIGGGYFEHIVYESCLSLIREEIAFKEPLIVDMSEETASDLGMVCGGRIEVYFELL